jgi:hypothetical protein
MNFGECAKSINRTLKEKNPPEFSSAWIAKNNPAAYRFIYKNVRNDLGGIDWDRVTVALGRRYQHRWIRYRRKPRKEYENPDEVEKVLGRYREPRPHRCCPRLRRPLGRYTAHLLYPAAL